MKKARLIITDDCNLDCGYCIMKKHDVYNSFESIQFNEFLKIAHKFDEFLFTGGEPFSDPKALISTIVALQNRNKFAKYYLYTNGELITPDLLPILKRFDGVNISIHNPDIIHSNEFQWMLWGIKEVSSIRLYIWDEWASVEVKRYAMSRGIPLIEWKKDDCEKDDNEERYRLKF